ncbi:MAG: BMP family ABC transporter substrate-binding protein [Deltaproteobacteria bacterium]|jgi:basic membrane protein A|nr:BMP family ABC transporter substrate-binding protein [Deltaproteobacteria bacterium]MBT4638084.1 BMP family ABC transporter substrate-binding protein [Deltaproteobacteria bacterium]MBT6503427.1 BMP family ABC transporter substrate-binding protein [Deltaproteobacteria bacterium]MBT6611407.1 BMP family ABC transporter substrate-binding protein [Deltaproteobacteria bacterium]MBT7155127.1 BMP family ABC transporter substrate-binding protein [Deltaproteobacteria bacterium]
MKKILAVLILSLVMSVPAWAEVRVGMVFDAGGKNDRSFNQSAFEGAIKARDELGIYLKDVEPGDSSAVEEAMRAFASEGYDLIFGIGFANATAVKNVATEYPKVKFAIVDAVVDLPNASSLLFKEHEASYLVGMIAGMRSRVVNGKRVVGFIGGMEIPLIHKFEVGYREGAKRIYPAIEVVVNYVGNTPTAWNDPAKAKEIAKAQIGKGSSVIYAAAGGSGNGLFDALKEQNGRGPCFPKTKNRQRIDKCVYGIGVDSNQNYIVPGQIVTSMLKRVDVAVFDAIKKVKSGDLSGGIHVYGLENNGVGYSIDKYNRKLVTPKMEKVVNLFRKKIIAGEIKVPDKR